MLDCHFSPSSLCFIVMIELGSLCYLECKYLGHVLALRCGGPQSPGPGPPHWPGPSWPAAARGAVTWVTWVTWVTCKPLSRLYWEARHNQSRRPEKSQLSISLTALTCGDITASQFLKKQVKMLIVWRWQDLNQVGNVNKKRPQANTQAVTGSGGDESQFSDYFPCYLDAECHGTGCSVVTTLSLEAKCLWFPTVQWLPSQARPQETGLSAQWAKMVTKVLFKLPSSGL